MISANLSISDKATNRKGTDSCCEQAGQRSFSLSSFRSFSMYEYSSSGISITNDEPRTGAVTNHRQRHRYPAIKLLNSAIGPTSSSEHDEVAGSSSSLQTGLETKVAGIRIVSDNPCTMKLNHGEDDEMVLTDGNVSLIEQEPLVDRRQQVRSMLEERLRKRQQQRRGQRGQRRDSINRNDDLMIQAQAARIEQLMYEHNGSNTPHQNDAATDAVDETSLNVQLVHFLGVLMQRRVVRDLQRCDRTRVLQAILGNVQYRRVQALVAALQNCRDPRRTPQQGQPDDGREAVRPQQCCCCCCPLVQVVTEAPIEQLSLQNWELLVEEAQERLNAMRSKGWKRETAAEVSDAASTSNDP